jgi:hypothetical protein
MDNMCALCDVWLFCLLFRTLHVVHIGLKCASTVLVLVYDVFLKCALSFHDALWSFRLRRDVLYTCCSSTLQCVFRVASDVLSYQIVVIGGSLDLESVSAVVLALVCCSYAMPPHKNISTVITIAGVPCNVSLQPV